MSADRSKKAPTSTSADTAGDGQMKIYYARLLFRKMILLLVGEMEMM
jgi:hypothetical protein